MADINARLLEALNGPAPQQKESGVDRFQFVEGSDGAQHIKITDLTGTPFDIKQSLENLNASIKANKITSKEEIKVSNFPPIQNVKDVDVKEELALIKQENIEIKNAQAEIITALGESNASLQATNNTLLSVIKDGRLQSDTQVTGSNVGYSTDNKPSGKEGDTFIELDTKKVFLHDGNDWSEF